jgi:adenine-specific DNA-methyltransferase
MENKTENPFEGTIELHWPGKHCRLEFAEEKWHLIPFGKIETKRALLFDYAIGNEDRISGYVLKGDAMSSLEAFRPYASNSIQFVYFDTPRLSIFPSFAEAGYSTATWLSLLQQVAGHTLPILRRTGFLAVHTDEETAHYARVVLDEVFGISHYVGTFAWQKQYSPQNDLNVPTDVLDYITVYSKLPAADLDKIGILVRPDDLKDDGDFRGCYIDGHKGARSGNEATKFKVNTSPYHWEILDSNLPEGRYHFDKILGTIWFESVNTVGDFYVKVAATDKIGHKAERVINFSVREQTSIDDEYKIADRIWWLLKNDNDIVKGGTLEVVNPTDNELVGIKGQEFSLIFKATGGEPITMRSDSPGSGRYWEFGLKTLVEGIARAKASFGNSGTALPSIKKYFDRDNAKKIQTVMNLLPWYEFGHTQDATQHCKSLKAAGITEGEINMMAKPQKLLGHLISLFAPRPNDTVMSIGDSNAVFASVAIKLNRKFIHVIGGTNDDIETWNHTASKRIVASIEGIDNESIEGNDNLPDATPSKGKIIVFKQSESRFTINTKTGDIEPDFSCDEKIEDFYAGLSGAYRFSENGHVYMGLDKRVVYVIPSDEILDAIMLDKILRQYPNDKLIVIYDSSDEELTAPKRVILRRAPFELI